MTHWECFLCGKSNPLLRSNRCECCGRPSSYVPKSLVDETRAKPFALHGLVSSQHEVREELVMELHRSRLDLTASDSEGWTALHCAVQQGQLHAVRALLSSVSEGVVDRKSMIEAATTSGGWRPLHLAVQKHFLPVVEELLLADADVNARLTTPEALTPLLLASGISGGEKMVDLLLQCGADPTLMSKTLGRSALHIAVARQQIETARVLLAQTSLVHQVDMQGLYPLQDAHLLPRDCPAKRELIRMLETTVHDDIHHGRGNRGVPIVNDFLASAVPGC